MKLAKFILKALNSHSTSLGDNAAFPPREDVAFDHYMITSRFHEVLEHVESEFGYIPTPDDALTLLSECISMAQRKEEPIKSQLETLAENIVNETLATPKETVILRTELVKRVEPLNSVRLMPEDDDDNDGYSFEDVDELVLMNKAVMKRRIIDSLVQGASYSLMMETIDDDQIYDWDEELVDLYYKIIYLNDYLLFTKKEKISDKNPMLGSYVDTDLGEGDEKTEIYAQGLVFPLLLQELFRGFFEIFASYGLPKDKKKANFIIHKADFLVAEAWDLRMGVGMWKQIMKCYNSNDYTYLPYIFSSIVSLKGDEFNNLMQNILACTKKGKSYVRQVISDVNYDMDYQTFKNDIQQANMSKCMINDEDVNDDVILT